MTGLDIDSIETSSTYSNEYTSWEGTGIVFIRDSQKF